MVAMTECHLNITYKPLVYISVLNWYNYPQTIRCIRELQNIDYDPKTIIVVDNASPNDSVDRIRSAFPDIRLIQARENLGYAAGHRHTVEVALQENADLLWIVNPDISFAPNVLSELVQAYLEFGDAIYGSLVLDLNGNVAMVINDFQPNGLPDPSKWIPLSQLVTKVETRLSKVFRVANIYGCSILIPLSIIRQFGFMEESFFMYGEEVDYCFRLARQGVSTYLVLSSQVHHENRGSLANNHELQALMQHYYLTRNRLVVYRRAWGWRKYFGRIFQSKLVRFYLRYLFHVLNGNLSEVEALRFKAIWHSLIGRMGKTYPPEEYLI